jgi:nitrile hydratase accessory protein
MNPPAVPDLPALPRDAGGPVFAEPWQAHAFALAVRLAEVGCFSWPEWVAALGEEIRAAQQRGDPDLGPTYYQHWLGALQRLCVAKGLVSDAGLRRRMEQWRQAYLHTPHGRPVELSAAAEAAPPPGR